MDNETIDSTFQIIHALGSLATFGAFLLLFRKDKNKQSQINKLINISSSLEAQNETMKEQNELISEQVDIFRNTTILKKQDDKALQKLRKLEEQKLKLSVKPKLWLNGAGYSIHKGELKIDLHNKGEDAELLDFKLKSDDIKLHSCNLPYDLDKGKRRYIYAKQTGNKQIMNCEYEIDVIFKDKLNNKYISKIKGNGANVRIEKTEET
jgi:hypothetical protein